MASTRHLLVAALMSTSASDARRRYEQALESLAKTATRMRRAEAKLIRRAFVAIQRNGGPDLAISEVADLGGDAKRWSDLWYSALARVRSVVSDKFHQLFADKEQELRKKVGSVLMHHLCFITSTFLCISAKYVKVCLIVMHSLCVPATNIAYYACDRTGAHNLHRRLYPFYAVACACGCDLYQWCFH